MAEHREIEFENIQLVKILERLEQGNYAIPVFQREFVWDISDIRNLWDSIYRHYPIGSLLIWETEEQLPRHRNILDIPLKQNDKGKYNYVLDGQQRVTSIIGSVKGAKRKRTNFKIFFDLSKAYDLINLPLDVRLNDSPFISHKEYKNLEDNKLVLPLEKLLNFDRNIFQELVKQGKNELADLFMDTSVRLSKDYKVSVIKLNQIPIEEVCDIFTRVNQRGKKLTTVDLVVAKTYRQDAFYLRDNLDELQEMLSQENYDTLDDLLPLRCLAVHRNMRCTESDILALNADDIISLWTKTTGAIIQAIRFLKNEVGVPTSKILPYSTMIVPLSYFFYILGKRTFEDDYMIQIKKWFWRSCFSSRYQSQTNEQIHEDCKWFTNLLKKPTLEPEISKFDIDMESITEPELSLNHASCNSILCVLASKKPYDFYNHQKIKIDEILIKGNKSELHHIFPRKSSVGQKFIDKIDKVANISFLPKATNKSINNKNPNEYFEAANKKNKYFDKDLESHLIPTGASSPIYSNDYNSFIKKRAVLIRKEIEKLLMF